MENQYWIGWAAGSWGSSWGDHEVEENPALVPAGHWKHLFRRIHGCETAAVTAKCRTKWNIRFPHAVVRIVIPAETQYTSGKARSRAGCVSGPTVGLIVPKTATVVVKTTTKPVRVPTIPAKSPFVRAAGYTSVQVLPPAHGCRTEKAVGRAYQLGWVTPPRCVKNPTVQEMLAWL